MVVLFVLECSRRVLRLSSGIDVVGPVMWDLALSLVLAWVISFLCMIKGIKTTGKVSRSRLLVAGAEKCAADEFRPESACKLLLPTK
jgi:hypothetical protein